MAWTGLAGRGRQTGRGLGPRITEFVNWCRSPRYPWGRRICLVGPGPIWPGLDQLNQARQTNGPRPGTTNYKVCQLVLQCEIIPWKENLPGQAWTGLAWQGMQTGHCLGSRITKFVNWCRRLRYSPGRRIYRPDQSGRAKQANGRWVAL